MKTNKNMKRQFCCFYFYLSARSLKVALVLEKAVEHNLLLVWVY